MDPLMQKAAVGGNTLLLASAAMLLGMFGLVSSAPTADACTISAGSCYQGSCTVNLGNCDYGNCHVNYDDCSGQCTRDAGHNLTCAEGGSCAVNLRDCSAACTEYGAPEAACATGGSCVLNLGECQAVCDTLEGGTPGGKAGCGEGGTCTVNLAYCRGDCTYNRSSDGHVVDCGDGGNCFVNLGYCDAVCHGTASSAQCDDGPTCLVQNQQGQVSDSCTFGGATGAIVLETPADLPTLADVGTPVIVTAVTSTLSKLGP